MTQLFPARLESCTDVYDRYDNGLRHATPYRQGLGPSPFDDLRVASRRDNDLFPTFTQRDCQIAGNVVASVSGGPPPPWLACTGYRPNRASEHLAACLSSAPVSGTSCSDVRNAYEARLRSAHGGLLPVGYVPAACNVILPALAARAQWPEPAIIEKKPPAAPAPRSFGEFIQPFIFGAVFLGGGFGLSFLCLVITGSFESTIQEAEEAFRVEAGMHADTSDGRIGRSEGVLTIDGISLLIMETDASATNVQVWSETHVRGSSSGGGGYLYQGAGHVSAPSVTISSTVVTTQRVFVQEAGGRRFHFDTGTNFSVAAGHHLRFQSVQGRDANIFARVRNTDTGSTFSWDLDPVLPSLRAYKVLLAAAALASLLISSVFMGLFGGRNVSVWEGALFLVILPGLVVVWKGFLPGIMTRQKIREAISVRLRELATRPAER